MNSCGKNCSFHKFILGVYSSESLKKYIKMMRDFDGRFFFETSKKMQKEVFPLQKDLHFRGRGEGDFSQGYITTNSQVQKHRAHFLITEMTGSLNFRGGSGCLLTGKSSKKNSTKKAGLGDENS